MIDRPAARTIVTWADIERMCHEMAIVLGEERIEVSNAESAGG